MIWRKPVIYTNKNKENILRATEASKIFEISDEGVVRRKKVQSTQNRYIKPTKGALGYVYRFRLNDGTDCSKRASTVFLATFPDHKWNKSVCDAARRKADVLHKQDVQMRRKVAKAFKNKRDYLRYKKRAEEEKLKKKMLLREKHIEKIIAITHCPWRDNTLDISSTARGADPYLGF